MIIVVGSVIVTEAGFDEALALSREHVARSRKEPGCLAHAVLRDTENPLRLVFVEQWSDQAALTEHFRVPESRAFAKSIQALASEPAVMTLYEATALPR